MGFNQLYRPVPERIIDCRNVPNLGCRGVGRCHHFLLLLHCLGIAVAHVAPQDAPWLHAIFPPRSWAIKLPGIFLLTLTATLVSFIGLVMAGAVSERKSR